MDISVVLEKYKLNFRVSAMIKRENEILVHHELNTNHITLPGGRVQEGENTIQALEREIKEEIGQTIEIITPISFMENFFETEDTKYQELLVTYEAKFKNKEMYNKQKIEAIEKEKLEFIWYPIEKLKTNGFKPEKMIEIIKKKEKNKFYINDERK